MDANSLLQRLGAPCSLAPAVGLCFSVPGPAGPSLPYCSSGSPDPSTSTLSNQYCLYLHSAVIRIRFSLNPFHGNTWKSLSFDLMLQVRGWAWLCLNVEWQGVSRAMRETGRCWHTNKERKACPHNYGGREEEKWGKAPNICRCLSNGAEDPLHLCIIYIHLCKYSYMTGPNKCYIAPMGSIIWFLWKPCHNPVHTFFKIYFKTS